MLHTEHAPLLFQKFDPYSFSTRLIDSICEILFALGMFGNLLGLFIFSSSRRSWRISTAYAHLAIYSSITNLFCLIRYFSIIYSTSRQILSELVGQVWWACKIYEFSFSFRIISSWITLFWMFERIVCISKRLQSFFHQSNLIKLKIIFPITFLIVIVCSVIGPPMYMLEPQRVIHLNITQNYCGINANASKAWRNYFHQVHFGRNHYTIRCLFSELTPTLTIILFNCCIVHCLIRTHRLCTRAHLGSFHLKQSRTTSWMNLILILHSLLFLSSLLSHIVGHWMNVEAHETWWVSLSVLSTCSLNFYLYCLSGNAFRHEVRRLIRQCYIRRFLKNKKYSKTHNQQ